jgi:hypothetical protein
MGHIALSAGSERGTAGFTPMHVPAPYTDILGNPMSDPKQFINDLHRKFEWLLSTSMLTIVNAHPDFQQGLRMTVAASNFAPPFRQFMASVLAAGQSGPGDGNTMRPMHSTASSMGGVGMQTQDRSLSQGHFGIPPNVDHQNPIRPSSTSSTVRRIPDVIDADGPSLSRGPESSNTLVASRSTEQLGARDRKSYADVARVIQQPSGGPSSLRRGNPSSNPLPKIVVDANGTSSPSPPQGMSQSAIDENMHMNTSNHRSRPHSPQNTPYTNDLLRASQNPQAKGITPATDAVSILVIFSFHYGHSYD